MIYRVTLISTIALVFVAGALAHMRLDEPGRPERTPIRQSRRIVSMAPSITETLYALGLGDRVVGVTRFCEYPPEVRTKPRVGGLLDPNYEAVVALKPDLVIILEEHVQALPGFQKLKLDTLVVSHQTIEGVIESFSTIGRVCGKGPEGQRLAEQHENRLRNILAKTESLPRPRVLMSLDRTFGRGHLADVYVAGVDRYFDRMITLAGGQNAYTGSGVRSPVISAEGIVSLNPEVIIDLVHKDTLSQSDSKTIAADWNQLSQVEAVKRGRVWVFDQDYAFVPGPRVFRLVEDLARAIHPEAKWERTAN